MPSYSIAEVLERSRRHYSRLHGGQLKTCDDDPDCEACLPYEGHIPYEEAYSTLAIRDLEGGNHLGLKPISYWNRALAREAKRLKEVESKRRRREVGGLDLEGQDGSIGATDFRGEFLTDRAKVWDRRKREADPWREVDFQLDHADLERAHKTLRELVAEQAKVFSTVHLSREPEGPKFYIVVYDGRWRQHYEETLKIGHYPVTFARRSTFARVINDPATRKTLFKEEQIKPDADKHGATPGQLQDLAEHKRAIYENWGGIRPTGRRQEDQPATQAKEPRPIEKGERDAAG